MAQSSSRCQHHYIPIGGARSVDTSQVIASSPSSPSISPSSPSLAGDIINFSLKHAWSHNGNACRSNSWVLDMDTLAVVRLEDFSNDVSQATSMKKYTGMIKCEHCKCRRQCHSCALYVGASGGITVNVDCSCGGVRKDLVKRQHTKWILLDPIV